jgi:putative addiction module killer protein
MSNLIKLEAYVAVNGDCPFEQWFNKLDAVPAAKVNAYLNRVAGGNTSNVKMIGSGLGEIKIDFGPGYRVYFGKQNNCYFLLVGGGTKSNQQKDIDKAQKIWKTFKESMLLSGKK